MTAEPFPPAAPLADALLLLESAVEDVNVQIGRLPADGPIGDAVALLRELRHRRQALAAAEATVEARVARALGTGKHEEHGVQVRAAGKTTWLEPRTLAWRIVEPLAVDRANGTVHVDPQLVGDMLDRLFDCAHVDYFRSGTMRDLGVEYDDMVKREPGRRTVQILSPGGDA